MREIEERHDSVDDSIGSNHQQVSEAFKSVDDNVFLSSQKVMDKQDLTKQIKLNSTVEKTTDTIK